MLGTQSNDNAAQRLLVVDDDPQLLELTRRILERAGYTVETATNGVDGADRLRGSFDAVVCDISLPGLNGLQVLRAAHAHDPDLPVILATGAPTVESAMDAVRDGAFQYLTKPVESAKLLDAVGSAVEAHRVARLKQKALALFDEARMAGVRDLSALQANFARTLETIWMAYQPIVNASDRSVFGYEALLRSGEPSLPHPGAILDAAERLDALPLLGRRIRAAATKPIADLPDSLLFVNLHPRDLLDEELFAHDSPLSAISRRVILEITERASLDSMKDVQDRVARLRAMGFRIAIDDLGAGYAGLTSFAVLEPEFVKLDMTLVRNVDKTPTKQKLIRSLTSVCKELGVRVVAEGIETAEERDQIIELGCDLLQGYLFAKPGRPFPSSSW